MSKKSDAQFQFNTLYKKPLESYDFNEFREKTLPMIRIGKLKKIQALVRGWYTRKFILPYKRRIHSICSSLCRDLLEEFIEDNLLPDIILEIINTNFAYKDYSLYAPDYRILIQLADAIENKVIHSLCEEVVKDITRFIVNDYLRKRNEDQIVSKKFDALTMLVDEYSDIIIEKDLEILIKQIIKEEADDYLLDANMVNMMRNQFIPIYCREIIDDAAWDIAEEDFLNDCLELVMNQHINDVIIDSAEAEKDRVDLETLENAFNDFIQRSILREAINDLILLHQEYHDEEYLNINNDKISENELSEFVLEEKKDNADDDFFSDKSPVISSVNKKNMQNTLKASLTQDSKFQVSDELKNNAKSFSSSKINEVYPKNSDEKNSYNFNPNFTAPKSPRNKKKATAEESSGILHGRRGTNTFYPDS